MLPFEPSIVVDAVREAAQIALRRRGHLSAEIKADNTLVTDADREVERFLQDRLSQLTPDFSFLGEETGLSGDPDAPCWVIDPIDGTTNYVCDIPLWCISVGAVQGGRAIFGVIAVPPQDELYWAAPRQGAHLEKAGRSVRLETPDQGALIQENLIACNTTVERVVDFRRVPCRLRNFGSLAYHLAALARGSLCAAMAHEHKLYDIAAGVCICQEAGCDVQYLNGRPWKAEVVAPKEPTPLLVAPPLTMAALMEELQML